jgi:hypothetical protein
MDQDVIDPEDVIVYVPACPCHPNRLAPTDDPAWRRLSHSLAEQPGATRYEQLEPDDPPSTTVFSGTILNYTSTTALLVQPYYWHPGDLWQAHVSD